MSSSAPSEELAPAGSAVGHGDPLVVAFTAPWCGHCRAMLPDLRAAAQRPGAPRLAEIDVTVDPETTTVHGITGTPTVIGYRGGSEVSRLLGRRGPTEIEEFFEALAAGTRHRRSHGDLGIRLGAVVILGVLGVVLEAVQLVVFAGVILVGSGWSEWRARSA